jgi:hypothetical protein
MLRLNRAIVAFFLTFALLFGICVPSAALADPMSAPAAASPQQSAPESDAPQAAKGDQAPTPVLLTIETDRYRVQYPLEFSFRAHPLMLAHAINQGFERVEGLLGKFKTKIEMFVPARIVSANKDFPEGLSIAGITFKDQDSGQIRVVVALWASLGETWPHELFHARMRELGLDPPTWFEEGAAHYVESPKGFNKELYALLDKDGPLSMEELNGIHSVTAKEMRMRATGWAIVYYLTQIKEHKFSDVIKMNPSELPDPAVAFRAIKAQYEAAHRQGEPTQPEPVTAATTAPAHNE